MFSYHGDNDIMIRRSSPGGCIPFGRQTTAAFGQVYQNAAQGQSLQFMIDLLHFTF